MGGGLWRAEIKTWALVLLLLTGCTVHPLPEDFSGVNTRHIVRQIRCETRQAVIDAVLGYLTDDRNTLEKVDRNSRAVGARFAGSAGAGAVDIREFSPRLLSGAARNIIGLIWSTGIAYNYNLEMTETNNNNGALNILNTLPRSARMFGFSAKLDLERQNTRIFTITDTFADLMVKTDPRYCQFGYQVASEDILYPITGRIGIRPVIQEFTTMAVFDNLSGDATKDFAQPAGVAQMAEQLEFTTTIDVSATPKVTFSPVGPGLHVADASFTAQSIRRDLHRLTLGLYVPKGVPLPALRAGVLQASAVPVLGTLASAPVRSAGEAGALAIVNQALLLKLFRVRTQIVQN